MVRGLSVACLAAMITVSAALAQPAAGLTNLAPNPSFEQSAVGPAVTVQRQLNQVLPPEGRFKPQPVLPEGWAFEGLAGLFDHHPHVSYHGSWSAAISAPLSGPGADTSATSLAYTVAPHWRTLEPIAVTGGRSYTFSAAMRVVLAQQAEDPIRGPRGAVTKVRWLDANGVPIGVSDGPSYLRTAGQPETMNWKVQSLTVTAPAGARGAHLLLGHNDDTFISQVLFDSVVFGR